MGLEFCPPFISKPLYLKLEISQYLTSTKLITEKIVNGFNLITDGIAYSKRVRLFLINEELKV